MAEDVQDRRHRGQELISYPEAVGRLVLHARPARLPPEEAELSGALGRFLAAPVSLDRPEPPVARSAMDGFAVRSADGAGSRAVRGKVFAGTAEAPRLRPGEAVAVMTGGTVAPGADAVVPVEQTRLEGKTLHLERAPRLGQHVRSAGEMGQAGRVLLRPGKRLTAQDLTAAAGCGADPLQVAARPRAALLSTGDEVVSWRTRPEPHQVRDSNRVGCALQLGRAGAELVMSERVRDEEDALADRVGAALAAAELVVTIGGVSMGEKDLLPRVFAGLGVEPLFHGVSLQPGKPVWAGTFGETFVLGLPGNPVSSFVVLELFGVPLIERLSGGSPEVPRPLAAGRAGGPAATGPRERFFPSDLELDEDGVERVTPRPQTGSGDWTSLAGAQALLHVPAHGNVRPGESVAYLRLESGP